MSITGQLLIGGAGVRGQNGEFRAIDAQSGEPFGIAFGGATREDLDAACALADDAFDRYRETTLEARAVFLETIGHNIMALGERDMAWPGVDHFIFVKVATGIGSGVISGGYLQRGAQGIAGDIGHIYVPAGKDVLCRCGNFGCLEAVASGPAIARALRGSRRCRAPRHLRQTPARKSGAGVKSPHR